ncbi:uncharacterized protein METZ01_LOCUS357089, partial [marine metagenome]
MSWPKGWIHWMPDTESPGDRAGLRSVTRKAQRCNHPLTIDLL